MLEKAEIAGESATVFTEALGLEIRSEDTYQAICVLKDRLSPFTRPIQERCSSKSSSADSEIVSAEEMQMPPLATILNKVKWSELRNLEALRDIYHGLKA